MHRIYWFDQQIRRAIYPNSANLAAKFEISRRQAQRDIEYMAESLRAPLIYVARERGYDYEDDSYVLPHLYITDEEQQILSYLAYRYGQHPSDEAAKLGRVARLLSRFTGGKGPGGSNRLPVFDVDPLRIQNMGLLSEAISRRAVIVMAYLAPGEEAQLRVWPLKLLAHYDTDYLVGICERDGRRKQFKVADMRQLIVTGEHFPEGETSEVESALDRDEEGIIRRKPFSAKLELGRKHIGNSWNGYNVASAALSADGGGDVLEIEFYDAEAFLGLLLVTEWDRLISPKWLAAKLEQRCGLIAGRLGRHNL